MDGRGGHDIKLSGTNCRPRVRVRDMGRQEAQDAPPVAGVPMWGDQLGALEPGKMMSVVVIKRCRRRSWSVRLCPLRASAFWLPLSMPLSVPARHSHSATSTVWLILAIRRLARGRCIHR